jgi:hypothetical protein
MDDLVLNDVALILGVDIDANVLIETHMWHMKYDKLLILKRKKKSDRNVYLKFM